MTETEIILVRHGQANTGAKTEESYDKLSTIGHQQAAWLGEHLSSAGQVFDHVICGTLRRHQETAAGLSLPNPIDTDPRVNEMRYFDMATEYERTTGVPLPHNAETFAMHVPSVFDAWHGGQFDHVHEGYEAFATRFADVVDEAVTRGGRTLIVTSGGVIGMSMARHLKLGPDGFTRMMLPVRNSSLHHIGVFAGSTYIQGYNATPHLDAADRHHARTTV